MDKLIVENSTTVNRNNEEAAPMEQLKVPQEADSYINPDEAYGTPIVKDEMFQLLSSWGFVDLYEYIKSCGINVDLLKVIDNEDLKELFANEAIGVRIEFKYKLLKWRRENGFGVPTKVPEDLARIIKILVEKHLENFYN